MKRAMFVVFSLLLTPSLFADAGSRLIPAGALVSCTTGDGKISSKTTAVGDPILCKVQFHRGDFMLPYNSYLGGEFAEYKDPGHFVGKGWMELDFDRLVCRRSGVSNQRESGRRAGLQNRLRRGEFWARAMPSAIRFCG